MDCISLNGEWHVEDTYGEYAVPAKIPGQVHLDLLAAEQIPDPFYRDNEEELMWIGERDWVYSRTFTVSSELLQRNVVLLQCQGLDTVAEVYINGYTVAQADNMFRTWEWDVKPFLEEGANSIEILFRSVFSEIGRLQAKGYYKSGDGKIRLDGHCQVRKEACNFGWDWGIKCVTCGIWRPIQIIAYDCARLDGVNIRQVHGQRNEPVNINVDVTAEQTGTSNLEAEVVLSFEGECISSDTVRLKEGNGETTFSVENPRLWWPNQMGEQNLYNVTVSLKSSDGDTLDHTEKRIGLRTLNLVEEKDQWGVSFRFEVNGVPFFAKGANWIPADVFQPRVTDGMYRHRLQSCADANMNMVRVWGGGIYEEDIFYEICDELGLCVWQDFMFACGSYPASRKTFMDNVEAEVEQNLKRLHHHPCVALYCGNNEMEGFVENHGGKLGVMRKDEYRMLFDELLPRLVQEHDPDVDYIPSSPYSPGEHRPDPHAEWAGDDHVWDVWHGYEPFEWYRTSFHRFCSEYGFQSFPEPKTCRAFTAEQDRNLNSHIMNKHQRCDAGNAKMINYMLDWYCLPSGFENGVWLSQIQQGLAIKYAVEHWRRNVPRCMGSLYWQINDCWPVASWASIDCFGRWKALHYMAKHFYAPLLLSGVEDAKRGTVELHVSSDCLQEKQCDIAWAVTDLEGREIHSGNEHLTAAANANTRAATLELDHLIREYTPRNLLIWLELYSGGECVSTNFVMFARPRDCLLPDPQIQSGITRNDDGSFDVTLEADKPALWAWLELADSDALYSDNFICLRPDRNYNIRVTPERELSKEAFADQLKIRSIYDTYQ